MLAVLPWRLMVGTIALPVNVVPGMITVFGRLNTGGLVPVTTT